MEVIGYVCRVLAHNDPNVRNYYIIQSVTLTMAPSLVMAGLYSLPSKYAVIFGRHTSPIKPMWYTYIFVSVDVFSILVQGSGGGLAASDNTDSAKLGNNLLIAGLVIQVVAMAFFFGVGAQFIFRVRRQKTMYRAAMSTPEQVDDGFDPRFQHIRNRKMFIPLVYAIAITFVFVFTRSIFRTVEMGKGWGNELMKHEIYFLVLETLMMFLAMLPITIVHPGMAFSKIRIRMHDKNIVPEEEISLHDSRRSNP